jgi:hypothetical protein
VTDERREQIIRLLETRDDHLPSPTRREHSAAGFVDHIPVRETCPDCLANDRRTFGCETCGGRGFIEFVRATDPYKTQKVQPYGLDVSRHERSRERDVQIERLEQQIRDPWKSPEDELAAANEHPEGWEIARAKMRRLYHYDALSVALELLRDRDPSTRAILHAVYEDRRWGEFSPIVKAVAERGLAFIDAHMPDPIRAPAAELPAVNAAARGRHADKGALSQRDAEIRRAHRAGTSVAEISARFDLKKSAIYEIVNGSAAA